MPSPRIALDRSSPVPLYFQVAEQLEQAILSGEVGADSRLENEISMARDLGLSRPTVRQAIQVLVDKGMLVRRRGVGTQVVRSGRVQRPVELTSLFDDLSAAGHQPHTVVLSLEQVPAPEDVAEELQVPPAADVWSLRRLRSIADEPLALMHNFLPVDVVDLADVDLERQGLYAHLRDVGFVIRVARQRISARGVGDEESTLLHEPDGAPLLTMQRTAYDSSGRAVEFGRHAYRPRLYSFDMTLVDR